MANKGICEITLFDPILPKMDCPLFGVTTVPQNEASEIVRQITLALQYMHNNDIVHRNVEPGNILINDANVAKLAGFGLAINYKDGKEAKPGNICGTPNFNAPEVINKSVHEPASDIWALGNLFISTVECHFNAPRFTAHFFGKKCL